MTFYFYMYHLRNTGVGACFRIPSKVYIFFLNIQVMTYINLFRPWRLSATRDFFSFTNTNDQELIFFSREKG